LPLGLYLFPCLWADLTDGWKTVTPLKRAGGLDDGPGVEAFVFPGDDGVQWTTPCSLSVASYPLLTLPFLNPHTLGSGRIYHKIRAW
jgi:hypothetical protein